MPLVATLHRNVFCGAYERMARLCTMLCRLGVLLALLQLAAWGAVAEPIEFKLFELFEVFSWATQLGGLDR